MLYRGCFEMLYVHFKAPLVEFLPNHRIKGIICKLFRYTIYWDNFYVMVNFGLLLCKNIKKDRKVMIQL